MDKGKPKKYYYKRRKPDYHQFVGAANQYLDLEEKLHRLKAREREIKQAIYRTSNEMSSISYHKLSLLGHQVVDQLRKERKEAAKSRKNAKNTGNPPNVSSTTQNNKG